MGEDGRVTCLVTGGTGLFGTAVREIVRRVKEETATDNDAPPKLQAVIRDAEFVFVGRKDGDLRERGEVAKLLHRVRPTHVLHLAARVGGLFSNMSNQIDYFTSNSRMNDAVMTTCHEFGVRHAVFCLSTCIFPTEAPLPLTETCIHDGPPHHSNTGYAFAKRMAECLCGLYRASYDLDWMSIIPTNLYGPNDNFDLEASHVVPGLIHRCHLANCSGSPFTISGSGKPLRQFLYSEDAARLTLRLLFRSLCDKSDAVGLPGSVILCQDPSVEHSIEEVGREIVKAMGFQGEVVFDTTKADGVYRKTASNSTLMKCIESDFKFVGLSEGIQHTVDWWNSNSTTRRV